MTTNPERYGSTRSRYALVALLFLGTALSYFDRQALALLKPTFDARFHWSDREFALMGSAFSLAAACAIIFSGWIVDKVGVRRSYGIGVIFWSLASFATALASSVQQFVGARVVLAVAETVSGPSSVRAAAQYLPQQERSMALGIITSATNIGAIIAPLTIPPIALLFGWHAAFILTGGVGLLWVAAWFRDTRRLPVAEHAAEEKNSGVDWANLLKDRRTWAIVGAKIISDWVFWFTLFWMPDFFNRVFHLTQGQLGAPIALIYAMAALGALSAGVLFPAFLRRGLDLNKARKIALVLFACCVLPYELALHVGSPWVAAVVIGVALFGHNGFTTNIFAMIADIVPLNRVATVMAAGSVASNVSGFVMIEFAGWSLTHGYGYWPMFAMGSVAYLVAVVWIHVLIPVIRAAPATAPVPLYRVS